MTNKSKGFILLMTLLIILVISLLALTCLQHVMLYHKAINKLETQHQNFYQLEHLAIELARVRSSKLDKNCVINKDVANQVLAQLTHQEGCSLVLGADKYQYLIEELSDFPCLRVYKSGQHYSTHHRRVTLISLADGSPRSLLQIRYLTPIQAQPCIGAIHTVTPGLSSWRYFAAI